MFAKINAFVEARPKLKNFLDKTHIHFLVLALLLYGLKAALYFFIALLPCNAVMFDMAIDKQIPFIPYFYVFYLSYYILPELAIWLLSFYNKRKIYDLLLGAVIANILCCICYLIQQVKMDRVAYENIVAPYLGFKNITDIKTFFYSLIAFQYDADSTALNCFPSLHATFGTMLFLTGLPLSKKDGHFPLWARIVSIVFGIGIILSTFFVKQHYFIDAVCGMILMIACYFLAKFIIQFFINRKQKKQIAE